MHDLLRARWCAPTLSIVDVRVGDDEVHSADPFYRFGPTRFSVIPRLAVGNIRCGGFRASKIQIVDISFCNDIEAFGCCSVRFVPDQRPEELVRKLTEHVEREFESLGSGNAVSVRVKSVGDWWEADPQSKLFRLAENALYKVSTVDTSRQLVVLHPLDPHLRTAIPAAGVEDVAAVRQGRRHNGKPSHLYSSQNPRWVLN